MRTSGWWMPSGRPRFPVWPTTVSGFHLHILISLSVSSEPEDVTRGTGGRHMPHVRIRCCGPTEARSEQLVRCQPACCAEESFSKSFEGLSVDCVVV